MKRPPWQPCAGMQVVMGLLVLLGLFFVCETPRFLAAVGRGQEALQVLRRLRGEEKAEEELKEVQAELAEEEQTGEANWSEIFTTPFFRNVHLAFHY